MGLGLAGSPPCRDALAHSGGEKSLSCATHHGRVPWDNSPSTAGSSGQQNPGAQPHKGTRYPVPTPMSWETCPLCTCPLPRGRKEALISSARRKVGKVTGTLRDSARLSPATAHKDSTTKP